MTDAITPEAREAAVADAKRRTAFVRETINSKTAMPEYAAHVLKFDAALTAAEAREAEKEARIRELEEALTWSLAEIDGCTNYTAADQFHNCIVRARTALSQEKK